MQFSLDTLLLFAERLSVLSFAIGILLALVVPRKGSEHHVPYLVTGAEYERVLRQLEVYRDQVVKQQVLFHDFTSGVAATMLQRIKEQNETGTITDETNREPSERRKRG